MSDDSPPSSPAAAPWIGSTVSGLLQQLRRRREIVWSVGSDEAASRGTTAFLTALWGPPALCDKRESRSHGDGRGKSSEKIDLGDQVRVASTKSCVSIVACHVIRAWATFCQSFPPDGGERQRNIHEQNQTHHGLP
jgi:hypothetical protein